MSLPLLFTISEHLLPSTRSTTPCCPLPRPPSPSPQSSCGCWHRLGPPWLGHRELGPFFLSSCARTTVSTLYPRSSHTVVTVQPTAPSAALSHHGLVIVRSNPFLLPQVTFCGHLTSSSLPPRPCAGAGGGGVYMKERTRRG
jgi:hypothetical protein